MAGGNQQINGQEGIPYYSILPSYEFEFPKDRYSEWREKQLQKKNCLDERCQFVAFLTLSMLAAICVATASTVTYKFLFIK